MVAGVPKNATFLKATFFPVQYKTTTWRICENFHIAFSLTVVTNEALEVETWHVLYEYIQIIYIPTNYVNNYKHGNGANLLSYYI
jgi:hypothetical protein